jgi:hypothetical protein
MKKILVLALFIGLGGLAFAQAGADLGVGFQYGTARISDKGELRRKITEPGILLSGHLAPGAIGFFARFGALFPSSVTEGGLTLDYDSYDYILFFNAAFGPSFNVSLGSRFALILDVGLSINDLFYGGSYKENINAAWSVKIENLGAYYSGGHNFTNVPMTETYNDIGVGLLGNLAMRFFFTQTVFLELGAAASFDFLRFKSYKFTADLSDHSSYIAGSFPADKLDPNNPNKLLLESNSDFSVFKQFTFIPSISVGFRL